ncbi:MAG: hypothetical protein AAGH76_02130 [Pseudomonadota bacterium]
MTIRAVGVLAVRLLALFYILGAWGQLVSGAGEAIHLKQTADTYSQNAAASNTGTDSQNDAAVNASIATALRSTAVFYAIQFTAALAAAILLWCAAPAVAAAAVPTRFDQPVDSDIFSAGIGVIGLYLVAMSLVDAAWVASQVALHRGYVLDGVAFDNDKHVRGLQINYIKAAIEFVAGALLILGRTGVARVFRRLRYGRRL